MARKATTATKVKDYWIVNPAGAIHKVNREHAAERLKKAGWRMATPTEIKAAQTPNKTYPGGRKVATQDWDNPIAEPWSPDIEVDVDVDAAAEEAAE